MKLVVSPAAIADLARLNAFLADKSEIAADSAVAALTAAIESLDALPERGRPFGSLNIRQVIFQLASRRVTTLFSNVPASTAHRLSIS
jgi:plasmid stabilization system protein ParE